jgi:hypothetical protein
MAGDVLGTLAALGPFFAVAAHPPGARPAPPWRPASELTARPGPLRERIAAVQAVLGARAGLPASQIDLRAAASAAHLGLVARFTAPALAAAALDAHVDLRPGGLWWHDEPGGPVPLSVPEPERGRLAAPDWHQQLLAEVIAPLTAETSRLAAVSDRVLWGNVASGANAAAGQVARRWPGLAGRAWEAARALSASPWLATEATPPGPAFRRSSCCLFYRLSASGRAAICGDCILGRGG